MTFEQLYYFTEVYRQKSLGQAANNLYISRQSLSASIRKIEQELGTLLFTRSVGGITPTPAGVEFYQHAQDILAKYYVLKQSMSAYSKNNKPLDICKIGISLPLISCYGDKLLEALSDNFSEIYFDFLNYIVDKDPDVYKQYDISIILTTKKYFDKYKMLKDDTYVFKYIATIPVYVWLSNNHKLTAYKIIPFEKLDNIPICALKNVADQTNCANLASFNRKLNVIELSGNFIAKIEKFGYYAIDYKIGQNEFFYSDLFTNHNVALLPTTEKLYLCILYNKKTCSSFYPLIIDTLTKLNKTTPLH